MSDVNLVDLQEVQARKMQHEKELEVVLKEVKRKFKRDNPQYQTSIGEDEIILAELIDRYNKQYRVTLLVDVYKRTGWGGRHKDGWGIGDEVTVIYVSSSSHSLSVSSVNGYGVTSVPIEDLKIEKREEDKS